MRRYELSHPVSRTSATAPESKNDDNAAPRIVRQAPAVLGPCGHHTIEITIIFFNWLAGPDRDIVNDLILIGSYSISGIVLLTIPRLIVNSFFINFKTKWNR